jgi:hypothetical protein
MRGNNILEGENPIDNRFTAQSATAQRNAVRTKWISGTLDGARHCLDRIENADFWEDQTYANGQENGERGCGNPRRHCHDGT